MNSELLNLIGNAPKVTLGEYIVRVERANSAGAYGAEDVRGVSNTKGFMETRANIEGRSLKKFLAIEPFEFVFNRRTTRNGEQLGLGFNMSDRAFILTEDYVAFRVKPEKDKELSPYFLYLYFLRDEFDRYVRSNSWGRATEFFNWEDMCRVKIPLPPIEVQQQYVDAYQGLTAIVEQNEALLKLLEETAQACVAECREKWPMVALSGYIKELNERNTAEKLEANAVRGISTNKEFIDTKANLNGVKLSSYKIVKPESFAFVADTSRRGDKMSLAFNCSDEKYLVSSISTVYEVSARDTLLPEFLYLQFKRPEFDRYARFNSWGSARETFNWDDMCRVKIPLPPIEVQRAYVDAYKGLTALIEENEALLKSLEVTAQTCVAECRNEWPMMELSSLITEINERNIDGALSEINARGVNTDKRVQKAKRLGENLTTYKIVHKNNLVFNPNIKISKSGEKFAVAINKEEDCIVSNFYVVMQTSEKLIPEFLYLWLIREDFARYMRFISCSSVRESFGFDDMCRVKIPLPPIEVQRAIVALYHCAEEARKIAEEAKAQLALACPAMIQRASRRF